MQKQIISIGLSYVLLVSVAWAAFNDVPFNHPHYDAINFVQNEAIVTGYDDGTFRPDETINRVELLKILIEAQPSPNDACGVSAKYTDTDTAQWYQSYLEAAACRGIATGYSDLSFRPANPVLAAESFKMITKTFGHALATAEGEWYMRYLKTLADRSIIPITIKAPDAGLTRSQMAEMIYRLQANEPRVRSAHTTDTFLGGTPLPVVKIHSLIATKAQDGYRTLKSKRVTATPEYLDQATLPSTIGMILDGTVLTSDKDYKIPSSLVTQLAFDAESDQLLVGFAADGHKLFYSQAGIYRPSYNAEAQYVADSGDLDDCNGRFVSGEYRYFLTDDYPHQPRCLHGIADVSFDEGGGGELGAPRVPAYEEETPTEPKDLAPKPSEVCQQMRAELDEELFQCRVKYSPLNETLCRSGGGTYSAGLCQFSPE